MNRRNFIRISGAATAAMGATMSSHAAGNGCLNEPDLLDIFTLKNDELIDSVLPKQRGAEDAKNAGGFPNAHDIYHVGKAAWYANRMTCGLVHSKSKHFQSERVAKAIELALQFLNNKQHDDGTIDLITTNFHSPPDTGFVVEPIALTLNLLRIHAPKLHQEIHTLAEAFLTAAGNALSVGGIHTPNHRWVVSMALSRINLLIPDRQFVKRIDQWLHEGIDIDAEGHYNERSTSVYSPLTNRCFITVARLLKRPELLDPVRKNLELTRYLVHANGEVVTEVSRRQDQFRVAKMSNYYYPYRYMALSDNSESFSGMAQLIESSVGGLDKLYGDLTYLLEDESLLQALPDPTPPPTRYRKSFSKSKIIRIRHDETDATVVANNETFLTVHHGSAAIRAVRFASAFFGKGQFKSAILDEQDDKIVLKQILSGPYLQPLPLNLLPGDGDWNKMPKQHRPTSEVQTLNATVTIQAPDGQINLKIDVSGTKNVPLAIEFAFDMNGQLSGVEPAIDVSNAYIATGDEFIYRNGEDSIQIRGFEKPAHRWTQLRGALPKLNGQSVYLTGFTPIQVDLSIT